MPRMVYSLCRDLPELIVFVLQVSLKSFRPEAQRIVANNLPLKCFAEYLHLCCDLCSCE